MPDKAVAGFRAVAYMRRSQDSGTGVSEEIQDEAIREYVERKGGEVVYWLPPDLGASSWTLERPSMQRALKLLADGKADTLVVAKLSRVTRRRRDWEFLLDTMREQGWTIKSADFDIDLSDKSGRLIAGVLIDFLGFEYEEKRDSYDEARRNAVLRHGVHGGSDAPLGYSWTVRGHDKRGNPQRGPLAPNADAAKVVQAFEARVEGQSCSDIARMLGVKSKSAARKVLTNRVYLGEARSGGFVKAGAHPGIVSSGLFARAQRTFEQKPPHRIVGRDDSLLARVLRCGTCGHSLVLDRSIGSYRCKYLLCTARSSIRAELVEPYLLCQALAWHAALNPMYEVEQQSLLPVLTENLAAALSERDEVEAANQAGELSPVAYGKALTLAEAKIAQAEQLLAEAEASRGWLGMDVQAVVRRIKFTGSADISDLTGIDVQAARDFIRQTVRATVKPVGRGRRVPVNERVEVALMTPVDTATGVPVPVEAAA